MRSKILRWLLLVGLVGTVARAAHDRPLMAADWESRLRGYQNAMCNLYQEAVGTGAVTYLDLLETVYGRDLAHVVVDTSESYRGRLAFQPSLVPSAKVMAFVVVDPSAARKGMHAYLHRRSGMVAVNPPGSRTEYDPARQATALAHEITHDAQVGSGRYPSWLADWQHEMEANYPDHPSTYVLSIEETEVRLAELRRLIWVVGADPSPTPRRVRQWLAAFGVEGAFAGGGSPAKPELWAPEIRAEICRSFPDFAELAEIIMAVRTREAEVRRLRLIDLWCAEVPALP